MRSRTPGHPPLGGDLVFVLCSNGVVMEVICSNIFITTTLLPLLRHYYVITTYYYPKLLRITSLLLRQGRSVICSNMQ